MAGLSQRPLTTRETSVHAPDAQRVSAPRVLTQTVFQQALLRQLRQSDRFEERFGLALISFPAPRPANHQWVHPIESLSAALRPADIVGWFHEGAVIGVIRSAADLAPVETPTTLEATLRRDMSARAGSRGRALSVQAEIYSPGASPTSVEFLRDALDELTAGSIQPLWRSAKRALDIAGAATLLSLSAPLMLAVAALVKSSSRGPVLVKQERIGERGQPFRMLKFRTMHSNANHEIHEQFVTEYIRGGRGSGSPDGRADFKLVADPRVTRVGQFLRRSSLDELPQLWNVVTGDMSLVGPRPALPYEVELYKPWHRRRVLEAKPGITGLWQVKGRSRTTFDEMVRLDLRYARNQSFWNDMKILMATPRAVLSGEGAR